MKPKKHNKLLHADLVKLSPFSLAQKIRQLHQTGEQGVRHFSRISRHRSKRGHIVQSDKREWHGTHHPWSYRSQAFLWSGEVICGINILPIATDMRAWMSQEKQLSLMPDQEAENNGGFTNPYTSSGVTLSLLMSKVISCSHDFSSTVDAVDDEIDSEIERLRLYNEIILYSARLCEVAIKQLLYCTQIPKAMYERMALGQLLESPCPTCKKKKGKKPHSVSWVATMAHPYHLCFEFEYCAMDHMDLVNKLRNSQVAHSDIQDLNIRTSELSRAQLLEESSDILSGFLHMLSHVEKLEQSMLKDLTRKAEAINLLKFNGLKAQDCNFNLVPGEEFSFQGSV